MKTRIFRKLAAPAARDRYAFVGHGGNGEQHAVRRSGGALPRAAIDAAPVAQIVVDAPARLCSRTTRRGRSSG